MYEIMKLIGRGANGDVFLARNKEDSSIHVIKKLKIRDISEKERETIETQLKLLKQFKHVNIVPFRDSFIDPEGNLNIVMAYCQGGDMHNLIQEAEGKKFEEKKIIDWIVQLALSIFYLHERRVLHRDIKTQNIFLTNGKIMLGDFGVSKVLDQAADLAITNIGTPYYMSPQQYRQKPYSYKSDIWAFGCIIYEMCTHKHVFEALNLQSLAVKVLKGIYPPVSEQYSKELRALIGEMLKQNPKDRPSIRQVLTCPFLFGKVQSYMKKIYSQKQKYEPEAVQSLVAQAATLGFKLEEPKMKKEQKEPSLSNRKKSQSKQQESRTKLKQQSYQKYQKLNQELKKEIEERNRAQQELERIQKQRHQKKKSVDKYSIQKPKPKQQSLKTDKSSKSKIKLDQISFSQKSTKIEKEQEPQEAKNKNFKIQQDYDMDYEEYSDKEQMNKIYEEDEDEHEQQEKLKTPKTQPEESKQKTKKPDNPVNTNQTNQNKNIAPQRQQVKKPIEQVKKVDLLEKQVKQKTSIISSIRNQISKIDFDISSDSEQGNKQQKTYNPAYTRITQKINDLKQKVVAQMGRNGYTTFLEFVRNNSGKTDRSKVIQMVRQENIGIWHIAENIVKLDRVLSKIPIYIN